MRYVKVELFYSFITLIQLTGPRGLLNCFNIRSCSCNTVIALFKLVSIAVASFVLSMNKPSPVSQRLNKAPFYYS